MNDVTYMIAFYDHLTPFTRTNPDSCRIFLLIVYVIHSWGITRQAWIQRIAYS